MPEILTVQQMVSTLHCLPICFPLPWPIHEKIAFSKVETTYISCFIRHKAYFFTNFPLNSFHLGLTNLRTSCKLVVRAFGFVASAHTMWYTAMLWHALDKCDLAGNASHNEKLAPELMQRSLHCTEHSESNGLVQNFFATGDHSRLQSIFRMT